MKRRICICLCAVMLLSLVLTGCGGKKSAEASPYEGKWIGIVAEAFGVQMSVEEAFDGAFAFEVQKGGKLTFTVGDKSGKGKWAAEGDQFTLTLEGETMTGTIGDNCITFDDMLGMGIKVIFAKEGTGATEPSLYWPEEEKAMLGRWESASVEELMGDGPQAIADPAADGLVLDFTKDHMVAVTHKGAQLGSFVWSVSLGYCIIESDAPSLYVTLNDDGSIDVSYSDDEDYLTYHMAHAESTPGLKKLTKDPVAEEESTPVAAEPELTEIQQMWNGWWYGGMEFDDCTGEFESLNGYVFSIAMNVELDENNEGTLKLYEVQGLVTEGYEDYCFAEVECYGDERYLNAVSGTCFDGDIYVNDWRFVFNMKYTDRIEMGTEMANPDGDELEFWFYLKRWDAVWTDEEQNLTDRIMGFDEHQAAVANGETDIFGNKAGSADVGTTDTGASSGSGNSALLGANPVKLSINDRDIVFVYYPGDQFEYNADYGKIKSTTGGAGILFDPMLGSTNYDELKTHYENDLSGEDDYSLTETTVNGYKALVLKYTDWLDSTMRVDVDFGGNHDGYYGMSFCVSGNSLDDCDTDLIWAIIESFELAK